MIRNHFHNITKCQAVPYLNDHLMKLGQKERFNSVRQCFLCWEAVAVWNLHHHTFITRFMKKQNRHESSSSSTVWFGWWLSSLLTHRLEREVALEDHLADLREDGALGVGQVHLPDVRVSHAAVVLLLGLLRLAGGKEHRELSSRQVTAPGLCSS